MTLSGLLLPARRASTDGGISERLPVPPAASGAPEALPAAAAARAGCGSAAAAAGALRPNNNVGLGSGGAGSGAGAAGARLRPNRPPSMLCAERAVAPNSLVRPLSWPCAPRQGADAVVSHWQCAWKHAREMVMPQVGPPSLALPALLLRCSNPLYSPRLCSRGRADQHHHGRLLPDSPAACRARAGKLELVTGLWRARTLRPCSALLSCSSSAGCTRPVATAASSSCTRVVCTSTSSAWRTQKVYK